MVYCLFFNRWTCVEDVLGGERECDRGGGGFPLVYGNWALVVFEFSFVKNNVCEVFDGIEGDVFHEACIILVETTKGTLWGKWWCSIFYIFSSCPYVCRI